MYLIARLLSDSTERLVLHTKTGTWTTSNGLSCNLRSFLISYYSITSFVCKFSTTVPFCSFPHLQNNLKTGQQGCHCHGRACQVHFYPSKAMAEAMDAADMPGLHSKLLKPHRNLGDAFNMFWRICCRVLGCFHLTELIEDVLHSLMKMIQLVEICE